MSPNGEKPSQTHQRSSPGQCSKSSGQVGGDDIRVELAIAFLGFGKVVEGLSTAGTVRQHRADAGARRHALSHHRNVAKLGSNDIGHEGIVNERRVEQILGRQLRQGFELHGHADHRLAVQVGKLRVSLVSILSISREARNTVS